MEERQRLSVGRSSSRRPVLATLALGVLCGLALLGGLGLDCGPAAAPPPPVAAAPTPAPDDVRTIEDYVGCLNTALAGNPSTSIADAVQCLPKKCTITLTMSNQSAQAACFSPPTPVAGLERCQLPRVILECPGPPKLMPSFLLCPTDSESDGVIGRDRVELGQTVDAAGNMRMADVPLKPGAFTAIDHFLSKSMPAGQDKTCNQGGCHDVVPSLPAAPNEILSNPLDPFDAGGRGNPDCIIATDRCDKSAITGEKECFPSTDDPRKVVPQSLSEVCNCIDHAVNDDLHPMFADQVTLQLCRALETYQTARGACVQAGCPSATGPECMDIGESCDPSTGASVTPASGYHCQPVDEDLFQCVADCPCREYDVTGGGKFLVNGAVSMVRLELHGLVASALPGAFDDSMGVTGQLSAFNYLSRTQVSSVSISSVHATRTGADFTVSGTGSALVDGSATDIAFDAAVTGGVATFEVRDASSATVLAGGTGEDGRSAFQLTLTP